MLGLGLGLADVAVSGARFDPALLFAGGAAGAWYDPADLSSMAQNADGTGPAAVGLPVGRIADKSGNGNHAVQGAPAARPVLRADSGGRFYLEFDGTDDELRAAFACSQPFDRISAIRQISATTNDRIFGAAGNGNSALFQATPPTIQFLNNGVFGPASVLAIGTNGVVTEKWAGAASRIAVDNNGYVSGDAGPGNPDGISLGSAGGAIGARFGHIRLYGIVMIGRALSDAETARLRRFMAARAGVAL